MSKDLIHRLNEGPILCAEGYLFAMERRGYLSAGAFVPEVVLEHPEVLIQLHREFIRSGTDIVQAFTYYGHREKMRLIGKEELLEPLQKNALKIALRQGRLRRRSRTRQSSEKLLSKIQQWPGVMRTETQLILSTYKD